MLSRPAPPPPARRPSARPRAGASLALALCVTGPVALYGGRAAAQAAPNAEPPAARTGRIVGRVVDANSGQGISDVQVRVDGTTLGALSGVDGRFTVGGVPAGPASLLVRRIGFQAKTVTGVSVAAGRAVEQNVSLTGATVQLAAVSVTASAERGTVAQALDAQRNATGIVTAVTAEQISRSPDADAAAAVQRVSGVTVQDGRYVQVRGLGERYTATSLNGARLPSPEPERKVVPLDLFPSGLLQSITTLKTFTPDQAGDFSGAVVDIRTREFPATRQSAFSLAMGANTAVTGQSMVVPNRVGPELFGFGGSARNTPTSLRMVDDFSRPVSQAQYNQIINSLRNVWTPGVGRGGPNGSASYSLGGTDPVFGQRVGYLLTGTYSAASEVRAGEINAVPQPLGGGQIAELFRFEGETGRTSVLWGGMFNASTLFGRNTRVALNNTYNRSADNEARNDAGRSENLGRDLERQTLRFIERSIRSNQLLVEQQLSTRQSADLALTSSGVTRREPDRSDVIYAYEPTATGARGARFLVLDGEAAPRRTFADLSESNLTAAANYRFTLNPRVTVRAGGQFRATDRDASNLQYGINGFLPNSALTTTPEQLFEGQYTQANASVFRVQPLGFGGSYGARDRVGAGYGMAEWGITDRLRVTGGARVERAEIDVTTEILGGSRVPARLRNTDVLPSLVANFALRETHAIRFSATQTLARPEYRELSPVLNREVLGGINQFGNPNLRRSLIQNADLKWEWYPTAAEVLSVGVFGKRFDDPIERVQVASTGAPQVTYVNADGATNYGVELEARKGLGFLAGGLTPLTGFTNVTLMQSDIRIGNDAISALTNDRRAMVGQAPWVVNTGLTYAPEGSGASATLLYNVVGRRISAAGVSPLPDIYEQPRHMVDLSLRLPVRGGASVRVDARNLLDARYRFRQGPIVVEQFRVGRTVSAGFTWRR